MAADGSPPDRKGSRPPVRVLHPAGAKVTSRSSTSSLQSAGSVHSSTSSRAAKKKNRTPNLDNPSSSNMQHEDLIDDTASSSSVDGAKVAKARAPPAAYDDAVETDAPARADSFSDVAARVLRSKSSRVNIALRELVLVALSGDTEAATIRVRKIARKNRAAVSSEWRTLLFPQPTLMEHLFATAAAVGKALSLALDSDEEALGLAEDTSGALAERIKRAEKAIVDSSNFKSLNDAVNWEHGIGKHTLLHIAAALGMAGLLRLLARCGGDANTLSSDGTPLHLAAGRGHARAIAALLEAGGRTDAPDRTGSMPIHRAASSGEAAAVRALCEGGADVAAVDVRGQTALHVAARRAAEDAAAVREMIEQIERNREAVAAAEAKAADADSVAGETSASDSDAERAGGEPTPPSVDVATVLLLYGAPVDAPDSVRQTPLHMASHNGNEPMIGQLLRHGADPAKTDVGGRTALHAACAAGRAGAVRALLSTAEQLYVAIEEHCEDADGQSPIDIAADGEHREALLAMVKHSMYPFHAALQAARRLRQRARGQSAMRARRLEELAREAESWTTDLCDAMPQDWLLQWRLALFFRSTPPGSWKTAVDLAIEGQSRSFLAHSVLQRHMDERWTKGVTVDRIRGRDPSPVWDEERMLWVVSRGEKLKSFVTSARTVFFVENILFLIFVALLIALSTRRWGDSLALEAICGVFVLSHVLHEIDQFWSARSLVAKFRSHNRALHESSDGRQNPPASITNEPSDLGVEMQPPMKERERSVVSFRNLYRHKSALGRSLNATSADLRIYYGEARNSMMLPILIMFVVAAVLRLYAAVTGSSSITGGMYEDNDTVLVTAKALLAVGVALCVVRILFMFALHGGLGPLLRSFLAMTTDLLLFLVFLLTVAVGYACAFHAFFGVEKGLSDFDTFFDSFITLIYALFGEFVEPANDIERADSVFGPLFFVSFLIVGSVVLLNLLVAMLTHTFHAQVVDEENKRKIQAFIRGKYILHAEASSWRSIPPFNLPVTAYAFTRSIYRTLTAYEMRRARAPPRAPKADDVNVGYEYKNLLRKLRELTWGLGARNRWRSAVSHVRAEAGAERMAALERKVDAVAAAVRELLALRHAE